jgi:retron-type reverse transcriptase
MRIDYPQEICENIFTTGARVEFSEHGQLCASEKRMRSSKMNSREDRGPGSYLISMLNCVANSDEETKTHNSIHEKHEGSNTMNYLEGEKFLYISNIIRNKAVWSPKGIKSRPLAYRVRKTHSNPLITFDRKSVSTDAIATLNEKELSVKDSNETKIVVSNEPTKLSKTNKKELVDYEQVIDLDNLRASLTSIKNTTASGVGGITKIQHSEKDLIKLHKDLKTQRYRPKPTRRFAIPKPDGGIRYLGISCAKDIIVQKAILTFLNPKVEPLFSEHSYGFRTGIGCHDALFLVRNKWLNVIWTISLDLEKYFDRILHDKLLNLIKNHCDQATTELIRKLIKVGYVDIHNLNDRSKYAVEGVPQSSILSPVLSNLYLNEFDQYVSNELLSK